MENRKDFIAKLKDRFGDCGLSAFLHKLKEWFGDKDEGNDDGEIQKPSYKIIDISDINAWKNHVEKIKDTSILSDFISNNNVPLENNNIANFVKSVKKTLAEMENEAIKRFKQPTEIDEDTSEEIANQTGKFARDYVLDLIRSCHRGIKDSQREEKRFYEDFCESLNAYLSSICVYRKEISVGKKIGDNAKWFEKPFTKEAVSESQMGTIDEIEVMPHYIPFKDENGDEDMFKLRGECIAFAEGKGR